MSARPVVFGEVLYDRFPDGTEVLGGAPFNVAWNLRGLGLDPLFVSRVGRDARGDGILAAMDEFGLDTSGVQRDEGRPTGTVEITLEGGEPRYEIVPGRAYDAIEEPEIDSASIALFYHGSLALREERSAATARSLLRRLEDRTPAPLVFFDVNLREPWWSVPAIEGWWTSADEVKLNEEELRLLRPYGGTVEERARALMASSGARQVFVTRGADGAEAFGAAGGSDRCYPSGRVEVVDTVGAGDAFSSVLILGRLAGWPVATRLERAARFAEAVVGLRGATTSESAFYRTIRETWEEA